MHPALLKSHGNIYSSFQIIKKREWNLWVKTLFRNHVVLRTVESFLLNPLRHPWNVVMAFPKSLPDVPSIGLQAPDLPIAAKAYQFAREHCDSSGCNHAARAAYWALILSKKLPEFSTIHVDLEVVVVSCILHDMGWARSQELLSSDKCFEVDSVNIV